MRLWVARILISPRTEAKIVGLHNISGDEVRTAVQCRQKLQFSVDVDEERGERVIVEVRIRERPCLVVLYDALHPLGDVWHLGSAYFVD